MRTQILLALGLAVLAVAPAVAQQPQPVTYVADFHVKPGKQADFMNLVKKYDQPLFEQLMKEGAVIAWGVDVPVLHEPGGATHSFWWTSADLSGFDKVFAALEENEKNITAEERQGFLDTVDISKHRDSLYRALVAGGGATAPESGAMPYSWINLTRVQPGKGDDYRKLWEQYVKPVYDKLVADGSIYSYELGVEEARSTDAFTHYVVVTLPNLAAREKVREAFRAANDARSPADRSIMTHSFLEVIDPAASRSFILRSVIFHMAAPLK